jgi:RimJ/RimL family protein N-acetyltransferase
VSSVPLLDGEDFFLRGYERDDFEEFAALMNNPQATLHTDGPLPAAGLARLFESIVRCDEVNKLQAWAVVHRVRQEYLGHAAIRAGVRAGEAELLIVVSPRHWRQGYGIKIGEHLIRYLELSGQYKSVVATVDPDHEAAIGLLARLGMSLQRWEEGLRGKFPVYSRELGG